jgi:predicted PurR-regulated permease PerM
MSDDGPPSQEEDPPKTVVAEDDEEPDPPLPIIPTMKVASKGPIVVLWTVQTSCILMAFTCLGAAMMYLAFVAVPLLMAYFLIFLMAPILDLLEKRPYACPCGNVSEEPNIYETTYESKMLCVGGYENEKRAKLVRSMAARSAFDGASPEEGALAGVELVLMGKVPHGIACLLTLIIVIVGLGSCVSVVSNSFGQFADAEEKKFDKCVAQGGIFADKTGKDIDYVAHYGGGDDDPPCTKGVKVCCEAVKLTFKITETQNNLVDVTLFDMGILIWHDKFCEPNKEEIAVMQEKDADNNWIMNTYVYGMYKGESCKGNTCNGTSKGEYIYHGENNTWECDPIPLFPADKDGTPLDELLATLGTFAAALNDIILILMLALFILFERPIGQTFPGDSKLIFEMEAMIMNYIGLKFAVSFLTGFLVAIFMEVCSVKIGMVWGLLAFLLNFIPNVGSMIAMVLPLPFILLDEDLEAWERYIALFGPAMVQGYVGNVLEPGLFGASLNLTEISVLLGLVFFAAIWGLYGAVLSVPILGGFKIMLHNTDHPLAKAALDQLRQDIMLDVKKDIMIEKLFARKDSLSEYEDLLFAPTEEEKATALADSDSTDAANPAADMGAD